MAPTTSHLAAEAGAMETERRKVLQEEDLEDAPSHHASKLAALAAAIQKKNAKDKALAAQKAKARKARAKLVQQKEDAQLKAELHARELKSLKPFQKRTAHGRPHVPAHSRPHHHHR